MADALQHPWFATLHTKADLVPPPPCPFNFELGELYLDHYLLPLPLPLPLSLTVTPTLTLTLAPTLTLTLTPYSQA